MKKGSHPPIALIPYQPDESLRIDLLFLSTGAMNSHDRSPFKENE
jgi:hypothetical protein